MREFFINNYQKKFNWFLMFFASIFIVIVVCLSVFFTNNYAFSNGAITDNTVCDVFYFAHGNFFTMEYSNKKI